MTLHHGCVTLSPLRVRTFWPDLSSSLARRFPPLYNVQECVALSVLGHAARVRIKGHGFSRQTYTLELSEGKFVTRMFWNFIDIVLLCSTII